MLRLGEFPETEQGGPVCASPGSSSSPFVIIKFSESRFCLSDTSRGSCEKTIFPVKTSEGGKAAETNVFHQGRDSLKGYSKQSHLQEISIITSVMEDTSRGEKITKQISSKVINVVCRNADF